MSLAIAALEQKVSSLQALTEQNFEAFTQAFETVDITMFALQRAFHDMANGTLQMMSGPDGLVLVDFGFYFGNFIACMGVAAFAEKLAQLQSSTEAEEDLYDGAFVFGGDVR